MRPARGPAGILIFWKTSTLLYFLLKYMFTVLGKADRPVSKKRIIVPLVHLTQEREPDADNVSLLFPSQMGAIIDLQLLLLTRALICLQEGGIILPTQTLFLYSARDPSRGCRSRLVTIPCYKCCNPHAAPHWFGIIGSEVMDRTCSHFPFALFVNIASSLLGRSELLRQRKTTHYSWQVNGVQEGPKMKWGGHSCSLMHQSCQLTCWLKYLWIQEYCFSKTLSFPDQSNQ